MGPADSGIDTLPPIYLAHHYIYFRELEPKISSIYFLLVFHWTLWISIGGIVFLTLLMLFFTKFMYKISWSEYIEYCYEIFGFHMSSNGHSKLAIKFLRLIILVWMFLIATVFSSFLMAQLANIEKVMPFHSLDELLHQDKYTICFNNVSSETRIFEKHKWEFIPGVINGENCGKVDMSSISSKLHEIVCERFDLAFLLVPNSLEATVAAHGLVLRINIEYYK